MTPARRELERKRIVEVCWWLKAEHRLLREDPAGAAWETLRRTQVFKRFFAKATEIKRRAVSADLSKSVLLFGAIVPPVRELVWAQKPERMDRRTWLPLGEHDPIARWSELFFRDCDPALDWVQLGESRRQSIRFNSPVLPRQERAEGYSKMDVMVCELVRDPAKSGQEVVNRVEWGTAMPMKPLTESGLKILPEGVEIETYVVVMFELGQPAEALERQFEAELKGRLFPGDMNGRPCTLIDTGDGVYSWQSNVPAGEMVYPKLWQEALEPNTVPRTREAVRTIPSRQSPFALCWIPARNDWKQVQSRFHNAVREENRPALENVCVEYWARPEVVPGVAGQAGVTLPPQTRYQVVKAGLKRKAAMLAEFWTGLTAFEHREAGVRFDKSAEGLDALRFFRENKLPDDPDLIRPALAAFKERLREIDALYEKIV